MDQLDAAVYARSDIMATILKVSLKI